MAKCGAWKIWHQFVHTTEICGTEFPECGTTSIHCVMVVLFPMGLWLGPVISWRLVVVCWRLLEGCSQFPGGFWGLAVISLGLAVISWGLAVISQRLPDGCSHSKRLLDACCYVLEACCYFLEACCYFLEASGGLQSFPGGFWMLVSIFWWCLDACCHSWGALCTAPGWGALSPSPHLARFGSAGDTAPGCPCGTGCLSPQVASRGATLVALRGGSSPASASLTSLSSDRWRALTPHGGQASPGTGHSRAEPAKRKPEPLLRILSSWRVH